MSELKFICPACSQHIQCEKAYVGHKLPCPTCGAELRIPFSNSPGGSPNSLPRAELVLNSATAVGPAGLAPASLTGEARSDIPKRVDVAQHTETQKAAAAASPFAPAHELHCVCPVCQSELRLRAEAAAKSGGPVPTADLVNKAPAPTPAPAPPPPAKSDSPPADPDHLSPEERERQIVAARAARPVEVYPAMKPRLSFVLSGGAAPTPSENEAAVANPPPETTGTKPPEPPIKAVQE